jgi:nitrate reductase NapE component
MFRAFSCPSSGAYQLQQQPLVYRRNVVVAVLLAVVVFPVLRVGHVHKRAMMPYILQRSC